MSQAGIKLRNIAIVLQRTSNAAQQHPVTVRDIYNARHRLRIDVLGGQSPIEALFAELSMNDFTWEYQATEAGNVTHLFFASHTSIDLVHSYPEVILLDCTYKTNCFNLPLLNIVGVTGLGTSFYLAFAFLPS